jgi:hypothetical protein
MEVSPMPLSPDEATGALRDIEHAQRRSANAFGYRMAAPHLFLWGVIWVVGYGASWLRPEWSALWPALVVTGSIASFAIGYASAPRGRGTRRDYRPSLTFLAVFAFIGAQGAIMRPLNILQVGAYFPILVALFYALIGIWTGGTRLLALGVAVAALTLGGYFWLPQYFLPWMAIVGGGGLILGGLWLRKV